MGRKKQQPLFQNVKEYKISSHRKNIDLKNNVEEVRRLRGNGQEKQKKLSSIRKKPMGSKGETHGEKATTYIDRDNGKRATGIR